MDCAPHYQPYHTLCSAAVHVVVTWIMIADTNNTVYNVNVYNTHRTILYELLYNVNVYNTYCRIRILDAVYEFLISINHSHARNVVFDLRSIFTRQQNISTCTPQLQLHSKVVDVLTAQATAVNQPQKSKKR